MEDAILQIILRAQDEASATIKNLSKSLGDVQKGADIVSGAMIATGAAIVGASIYSTKLASDFESAMTMVQTGAGASEQEVKNMSASILSLAGQVGQTPIDLANALYYVESAGYRGSQALEILKISAEGAAVGHANLTQTANVLTSVLASGIGGVKTISDAMGVLNATVGGGKMKLQDLVDAMSTGILPAAKAAGINMQQLGATLDVFTNNGVPAVDAASRLRMSIGLMVTPSSNAIKELQSMGMNSKQLANDMQSGGIVKALKDLHDHMKNLSAVAQENVLGKMFGTREGASMMTLLGNVDQLQGRLDNINKTGNNFGGSWAKTSGDADMAFKRLWASVQALGIEYGNKLLPAVTNVTNVLASNLVPAVTNTVSWFKQNQVVLEVVAGIIAGVLLPALVAYQVQIGVNNVKAIYDFITGEWKAIAAFLVKIVQLGLATAAFIIHTAVTIGAAIATGAMTVATWALNAALFILTSPIALVVIAILILIGIGVLLITHWSLVQAVAKTVFGAVGSVFTGLGNTIHGVVNAIIQDVRSMVNSIIDNIDGLIKGVNSVSSKVHLPTMPEIPHFASGTSSAPGGLSLIGENGPELVNLPRGSQVIPNNQINKYNSGGNVTIENVNIRNDMDIGTMVRRLTMEMKFNSAI